MPGAMPNAVVILIEPVARQAGSAAGAAAGAAVGGSGAAGTTGSGGDASYRVTLRMDDGTTRVVTQDKAPTFRSGDRVNMTDGMITH
jgi:outer membrane lipoprotein SlyB